MHRTTARELIAQEKVELLPTWSPYPVFLVSLVNVKIYSVDNTRVIKPLTYNLSSLDMSGQWWHRTSENSQTMSDLTYDPLHEDKPLSDTAFRPNN